MKRAFAAGFGPTDRFWHAACFTCFPLEQRLVATLPLDFMVTQHQSPLLRPNTIQFPVA